MRSDTKLTLAALVLTAGAAIGIWNTLHRVESPHSLNLPPERRAEIIVSSEAEEELAPIYEVESGDNLEDTTRGDSIEEPRIRRVSVELPSKIDFDKISKQREDKQERYSPANYLRFRFFEYKRSLARFFYTEKDNRFSRSYMFESLRHFQSLADEAADIMENDGLSLDMRTILATEKFDLIKTEIENRFAYGTKDLYRPFLDDLDMMTDSLRDGFYLDLSFIDFGDVFEPNQEYGNISHVRVSDFVDF